MLLNLVAKIKLIWIVSCSFSIDVRLLLMFVAEKVLLLLVISLTDKDYLYDERLYARDARLYVETGPCFMALYTTPPNLRKLTDTFRLNAQTIHSTRIFKVKLTFGKLTVCDIHCAAFIFDTRMGFLWKFLRQKMSRPERHSTPQPSDSCRML